MLQTRFFYAFFVCFGLHIVVMITVINILQEIFAIDMLTVLKPFSEHDHKHVLRLSRLLLDGDTAWISCRLYIFCALDIFVESIGRFICHQDQSNKELLFIRPQFGSQFGVFRLLGFIKPMQHFNLNVFLYTPFKMLCQQWIIKRQASDKNTPCS